MHFYGFVLPQSLMSSILYIYIIKLNVSAVGESDESQADYLNVAYALVNVLRSALLLLLPLKTEGRLPKYNVVDCGKTVHDRMSHIA